MGRNHFFLILIIILLFGIFFRTYKLVERFGFAHDADLYSWIVKDIVIDHHPRLIGQLTSTEGIFIGPLFYYLLIPFFLIFNMDPIGSAYFSPVVGILNILSYYFVLSKLFNKKVGIIAAFLQAVSLGAVGFDRWVVPTITTKLWAIWYLYTILMIIRGNFKVLPLLGLLIGLIWQVHLALLPALLAVPFAFVFSKKIPRLKQIAFFILSLVVSSLPLLVFEIKHNFIQTISLVKSFLINHEGATGWYKFWTILDKISKNTDSLFFSPGSLPNNLKLFFSMGLLLLCLVLIKKKILKAYEASALLIWIAGVVSYFSFSSVQVSEYYFANLEVIFLTLASLLICVFFNSSVLRRYLTLLLLFLLLFRNVIFYLTSEPFHIGYAEKKAITQYIVSDAKENTFPCVAINYITLPGENVGFRYLFFINSLKLAQPSDKVPVYSIVFPYEWSKQEVKAVFGHMGVIPPAKIPPRQNLEYDCSGENTNLTDPLFGYVE
ncbi:MAG: glycosyltransferase family 39 protein [Patescibacteria group bacterium]